MMLKDVSVTDPSRETVKLPVPVPTGVAEEHLEEAPVELVGLNFISFGAAHTYELTGGLPVHPDVGPGSDLTRSAGACSAVAAFIIGHGQIFLRSQWTCEGRRSCRILIRAMARDEIRIREQLVQIDGGSAVVDLPVLGLPSNRVGVVDEHWQWECRSERGSFVKAKVTQGSQSAGVPGAGISFVRIYFTASMPLSATGG